MVRRCVICNDSIAELDPRRRHCLSIACKNTSNLRRNRKYRNLHPERNIANIRKYSESENGKAMLLLNNAKDRAKRHGLPIDIDFEFVLEKLRVGTCEITGTSFDFAIQDKFRANPIGPSLDRIIPNRGYTKDNVRMVCFAVNVMHHDWPDELMLKMARLIVDNEHKLHTRE